MTQTGAVRWDERAVEVAASSGATQRMSHEEVAALNNYDARMLGLPDAMEAVLSVAIEGRIDMPQFAVRCRIEPFDHLQPWAVYKREGAFVAVGARVMRLNLQQFNVFKALDAMQAARGDVAARLRAWPALEKALHAGGSNHVLMQSDIPLLRVIHASQLPPQAMTRDGAQLKRAFSVPDAAWAMDAGRRYYLRSA